MILTAYKGQPLTLDINALANNSSNGKWVVASAIIHNNSLGSYVDKVVPDLVQGDTYRVTYTVSSYVSCNVRVYLGNSAGDIHTANGEYSQVLIFTGQNRIRFWSNGSLSVTHYKLEHLQTVVNQVPVTLDEKEVQSFTLSYDPILNQWISFHSYLPNNYLPHPTKFITKRNDSELQLGNSGDYGKYFDEDTKSFILETIFNEDILDTKTFDSIMSQVETSIDNVTTNTFFDNTIIYNEYQCTGTITLDSTNLTKKERNWDFNKILDITNNSNTAIFVKDWDSIKTSYPIDKVVNVNKIDTSKPWFQRGRLRDKYIAVRFMSTNLHKSKFIVKFVSSTYRISQR